MSKANTQTRYKFLREGSQSEYGDFKWRKNKWYKHEGDLEMCESGFHCCALPYDAFGYVQGEILAIVEVRGTQGESSPAYEDKEVWSEMRVVKRYKWTKMDSVAFSVFAAELVIAEYEKHHPDDPRPRDAIEAAKKWLENPTEANESAESAARSAEWSARSAESAARSAAWSAAKSAESAIVAKCNQWMIDRIPELKEI